MSPQAKLLALATAVPPYALAQADVMERARMLFRRAGHDIAPLLPVFDNAGISRRYSCVPIDWYEHDHGWADRNQIYLDSATALLEQAARDCLAQAGMSFEAVDQLVVVSSTGIATPSLDALLMDRLPFRPDCRRLPVFGLGCVGGVVGLSRAAQLARAKPGSVVLCLIVELCALTFRKDDLRKSNIVATALFGDGAAAALVRAGDAPAPALAAWGEHRWPDTLDVMGWDVSETGLAVRFSRDIPRLVRERFRSVTDAFLARAGLMRRDVDGYICHPGGAKVIETLEDVLELQRGTLRDARETLREYGNMSAATVLFVLQRTLRRGLRGRHLMTALGPGFTAGFLTLEGR